MSSISGLSGIGTESLQSLWQTIRESETEQTGRAGQAPPAGGPTDDENPMWADIEESAETSGLTDEQIESLKADLKDAISNAVSQSDSTTDGASAHEAVDNAILSTLQEYGVDTSEIESHMAEAGQQMQGGRPMGPPPGAEGGQPSDQSSTTSGVDTSALLASLFPLIDEEA